MIDVDLFKRFNDTWGHLCGDACLLHIANICKKAVQRSGDTIARYSGEEFVLLLPSTHLAGAAIVAESIRKDIESTPFSWKNESIELTLSLGVASSMPDRTGSYEQLIQFADEALYAAKDAGRNTVLVHQVDESGKSSIQPPPATPSPNK
ncbi:MAG: diguanylate cyclase (GGDEF)-like protein [Oleiphilaceae bacterium]|jgi:diguanylate cyclase (GGDEF)-like protein